VEDLPQVLGVRGLLDRLTCDISEWIEQSSSELQEMLRWQLLADSKYFRPMTIFAAHFAMSDAAPPPRVLRSAVALELFHNVSLIIDDILDRSRHRRGKPTLHCRFGNLPALMASGYITAAGFKMVAKDPFSVRLLADLLQRLGIAECLQWRLRREPLGVEDWRAVAGEDTGSMFETCAVLGTRNEHLRRFGRLLGMLYHGCDDVADIRGTVALGGGGNEDLRDGILTLPAAIAIADPETAVLFRNARAQTVGRLTERVAGALPDAEEHLDKLADEARREAEQCAVHPEPLFHLIRFTRALSRT
jgi:geranylgeranyl pyrophosphate synthase